MKSVVIKLTTAHRVKNSIYFFLKNSTYLLWDIKCVIWNIYSVQLVTFYFAFFALLKHPQVRMSNIHRHQRDEASKVKVINDCHAYTYTRYVYLYRRNFLNAFFCMKFHLVSYTVLYCLFFCLEEDVYTFNELVTFPTWDLIYYSSYEKDITRSIEDSLSVNQISVCTKDWQIY